MQIRNKLTIYGQIFTNLCGKWGSEQLRAFLIYARLLQKLQWIDRRSVF